MFGHAPRALWSRWCAPDELGRIELACRSVLVRDGDRTVLLETGIGAFFPPKLRERYGVVESEHVLLRSLARHGVRDEDVSVVVLSHLHFDHAGGLLAPYEEGAPLRLLFPRARFVTGRTAFERARHPHRRDQASFVDGLAGLLESSGRLILVDEGTRTVPELGERFRFFETNGHTPGMLHTVVQGARDSLLFAADLIPGVPWLHPAITMGYDRFAEQLVEEKTRVLDDLAEKGGLVAFTHDARVAFARVERDGRGGFVAKDRVADDAPAIDLDEPV